MAHIRITTTELRYLEQEAAYYRWLREGHIPSPILAPGCPWVVHAVPYNGITRVVPCYGAELDRLIGAIITRA